MLPPVRAVLLAGEPRRRTPCLTLVRVVRRLHRIRRIRAKNDLACLAQGPWRPTQSTSRRPSARVQRPPPEHRARSRRTPRRRRAVTPHRRRPHPAGPPHPAARPRRRAGGRRRRDPRRAEGHPAMSADQPYTYRSGEVGAPTSPPTRASLTAASTSRPARQTALAPAGPTEPGQVLAGDAARPARHRRQGGATVTRPLPRGNRPGARPRPRTTPWGSAPGAPRSGPTSRASPSEPPSACWARTRPTRWPPRRSRTPRSTRPPSCSTAPPPAWAAAGEAAHSASRSGTSTGRAGAPSGPAPPPDGAPRACLACGLGESLDWYGPVLTTALTPGRACPGLPLRRLRPAPPGDGRSWAAVPGARGHRGLGKPPLRLRAWAATGLSPRTVPWD